MKRRDSVTAICCVILGLAITLWSSTFPFGRWDALGPGILPFGCGLILILLGSILFFQAKSRVQEKTPEALTPLIPHGVAFSRVALTLAGMLLSAILLQFFGYVLTTFFLILLLMRANEPQRWRVDLFYTCVFTVGSYFLFQVLLKATLPTGFMGF